MVECNQKSLRRVDNRKAGTKYLIAGKLLRRSRGIDHDDVRLRRNELQRIDEIIKSKAIQHNVSGPLK